MIWQNTRTAFMDRASPIRTLCLLVIILVALKTITQTKQRVQLSKGSLNSYNNESAFVHFDNLPFFTQKREWSIPYI